MSGIRFKNLNYFFLAACSLLISGILLHPTVSMWELCFLVWTTISGIFLVYRINDVIDHTSDFHFDVKAFLSDKLHLFFFAQSVLFLLPVTLMNMSLFQFWLLSLMLFMGVLYSLNVELGPVRFRIKRMFLVKNIFIGLCWGGLVLIGSNQQSHFWTEVYFAFASLQVFIGSIIRDLSDIEHDTRDGVKSMPVVLGKSKTVKLLAVINFCQLVIIVTFLPKKSWILPLIGTSLWRFLILYQIQNSVHYNFWSQKMNLLTCTTIMVGTLLVWIY